jgi:hypothetical protein
MEARKEEVQLGCDVLCRLGAAWRDRFDDVVHAAQPPDMRRVLIELNESDGGNHWKIPLLLIGIVTVAVFGILALTNID